MFRELPRYLANPALLQALYAAHIARDVSARAARRSWRSSSCVRTNFGGSGTTSLSHSLMHRFFDAPAYRRSFCKNSGSQVPSIFPGTPSLAIPTGLVDGEIPARVIDHIWVSKKANWLDLRELSKIPQYDTEDKDRPPKA